MNLGLTRRIGVERTQMFGQRTRSWIPVHVLLCIGKTALLISH
uniref:Uncharacterized protein n=1 Tax=Brassica campestris TaxID=3711 RepID=A0A3P6A7T6_BRACM|nr:unnamed protein product [Brassica rapa]